MFERETASHAANSLLWYFDTRPGVANPGHLPIVRHFSKPSDEPLTSGESLVIFMGESLVILVPLTEPVVLRRN